MLENHGATAARPFALAPDTPPPQARLTNGELARVYRDEQPRLLRYVRAYVRDPDDVLDLVQEAFFRLIRSAPELDVHAPGAYLRRTARNLLVDRWRRAATRPIHVLLGDDDGLPVPATQSWGLEAQQLMKRYRSALATLPPKTRDIFLLHRIDRKPHRAIAAQFGISVAGVEYHMARALAHLSRQLDL